MSEYVGISYTNRSKSQRVLRRLHEEGLEGDPEGISWLLSPTGIQERLYGFKILIPPGVSEQEFCDRLDAIIATIPD